VPRLFAEVGVGLRSCCYFNTSSFIPNWLSPHYAMLRPSMQRMEMNLHDMYGHSVLPWTLDNQDISNPNLYVMQFPCFPI
jgi:hypothetical protein